MERARRVPGYATSGASYPSMWSWTSEGQVLIDTASINPLAPTADVLDVQTGVRSKVPMTLDLLTRRKHLMLEHPYTQGQLRTTSAVVGAAKFPPGVGPNVEVTGVALSPQKDKLAWW